MQAHKAPTWTSLIKSLALIKQRTSTHGAPGQNNSNLESISGPCQCSPHSITYHNQSTSYRQRFSAAASQKTGRYFQLCLGHDLHPWAVQLDDSSKGTLKLTTKHSGSYNTSSERCHQNVKINSVEALTAAFCVRYVFGEQNGKWKSVRSISFCIWDDKTNYFCCWYPALLFILLNSAYLTNYLRDIIFLKGPFYEVHLGLLHLKGTLQKQTLIRLVWSKSQPS